LGLHQPSTSNELVRSQVRAGRSAGRKALSHVILITDVSAIQLQRIWGKLTDWTNSVFACAKGEFRSACGIHMEMLWQQENSARNCQRQLNLRKFITK
jgi:hypothetical protein